jgi:hypothetical protein
MLLRWFDVIENIIDEDELSIWIICWEGTEKLSESIEYLNEIIIFNKKQIKKT